MNSAVALLVVLSFFGAAFAQNNSFCVPKYWAANTYTIISTFTDSTFFVEYAGDYYFDVTQEAARVDYSSIDDNSKSFSVIVRYDQGLQYTFDNVSCVTQKLNVTSFTNCGTYADIEGPYMIAGELGSYLLTINNANLPNTTTELLAAQDSMYPISFRSEGPISGGYFLEYILMYNLDTSAIPSAIFAPPSDCPSTPSGEFEQLEIPRDILMMPLF